MPPSQNNNPNGQNGLTPTPQPTTPPPSQPGAPAPTPSTDSSDPSETSRYDFFMNPPKQAKPKLLGSGSNKNLFIIAGAIVAVLFIIVVIVAAGSGSKPDTTSLLSVAQAQEEVIRVANDGSKNSKDSNLQNFSQNTIASVTSAQQQIIALMLKQGIKASDKQLKLGENPQTDQALTTALAANSYDTTYKTIMQSNLDNYENRLDSASTATTSKSTRAVLQQQHDAAVLLEKQLNQ